MTIDEVKDKNIRLTDVMEAIVTEMCDNYCKWPDYYKSSENDGNWEMMMDGACNECPLNYLGGC